MIRKAREEDLLSVANIYEEVIAREEKGENRIGWVRDIYPTMETAREAFEKDDLFVDEEEGTVVATARINQEQVPEYARVDWEYPAKDEDVMVLHTLAVSPSRAGRGIGTRFEQFYEQYALEHGCHYLRIDTNRKNTAARGLYKKLGYQERGIIPCTFNGIRDVFLVCLEKRI